MALTGTIRAELSGVQSGPNDYGGQFSPSVLKIINLSDGISEGNADMLFTDVRVVSSASNDDIDLTGVLTDAFGTAFNAAKLVGLIIINGPVSGTANTTDLTIGAGTNPFLGFLGGTTPTVGPIKPGGVFMIASGSADGIGTVVAGTGDILRIANSSGAGASYQIGILARSA